MNSIVRKVLASGLGKYYYYCEPEELCRKLGMRFGEYKEEQFLIEEQTYHNVVGDLVLKEEYSGAEVEEFLTVLDNGSVGGLFGDEWETVSIKRTIKELEEWVDYMNEDDEDDDWDY